MKVGTLMDPFHRAYRYIPNVGPVLLNEADNGDDPVEEVEAVNDEPEPDDPDLSDHEAI